MRDNLKELRTLVNNKNNNTIEVIKPNDEFNLMNILDR